MRKWVGAFGTGFVLFSFTHAWAGGDDFLKNAAGHYEGTLTSHAGDNFSQIPVKTDLSADKNAMKTVTVTDEGGSNVLVLHFDKINADNFLAAGPFLLPQVRLQKPKDESCFSAQDPQPISICFYRDLITVEISDKDKNPQISLSVNKFVKENSTAQEKPQAYGLKAAIARAWKLNFDNRIEFEHVMQAKFAAKAAKRSLLPRISFSTIVNNLQPTLLTVIAAAGDLLPFLFPTRWLEVKRRAQMSEAEQDTMTLMRLDTATQLEALFYNYQNDSAIRDLYTEVLAKAKLVRGEVYLREVQLGTLPDGSTDNMDSVINFLQQSYVVMDALLQEDRAAIAEVMGFFNPRAVSDISLEPETLPIGTAQPLDVDAVTKIAIERSVELRQVDFIIAAAKINKKAVMWNWLDPTGDPNLGLGFGLKPNIDVASSQIIELQILRDQIKQKYLGDKVFTAVTDYNQALKTYSVAAAGQQIQMRRLKQADKTLNTTGTIDLFALVQIFQDYLTAGVNAQVDIFTFRVARARIDRLLLQGYYVDGSKPPTISRPLNK